MGATLRARPELCTAIQIGVTNSWRGPFLGSQPSQLPDTRGVRFCKVLRSVRSSPAFACVECSLSEKGWSHEASCRIVCRCRVLAFVSLAPALAQSPQEGDLYDCEDFKYQEDAQKVYDRHPGDPYGLDGPIGEAFEGKRVWPARTVRTGQTLAAVGRTTISTDQSGLATCATLTMPCRTPAPRR